MCKFVCTRAFDVCMCITPSISLNHSIYLSVCPLISIVCNFLFTSMILSAKCTVTDRWSDRQIDITYYITLYYIISYQNLLLHIIRDTISYLIVTSDILSTHIHSIFLKHFYIRTSVQLRLCTCLPMISLTPPLLPPSPIWMLPLCFQDKWVREKMIKTESEKQRHRERETEREW